MDKYLIEYIERLQRAADQAVDMDIDNSTTEHALAAIRTIIERSENTVKVFTTAFRFDFWSKLESDMQNFLKTKEGATFEVISILPPSTASLSLMKQFSKRFSSRFKAHYLKGIKKSVADDAYNFVTGDDSYSRFELSDGEASKGIVKAIINFGNQDRVKKYNNHFSGFKTLDITTV